MYLDSENGHILPLLETFGQLFALLLQSLLGEQTCEQIYSFLSAHPWLPEASNFLMLTAFLLFLCFPSRDMDPEIYHAFRTVAVLTSGVVFLAFLLDLMLGDISVVKLPKSVLLLRLMELAVLLIPIHSLAKSPIRKFLRWRRRGQVHLPKSLRSLNTKSRTELPAKGQSRNSHIS